MSDRLTTYLHNHQAGANAAIDLLEKLRQEDPAEPFQPTIAELLEEINEDLGYLQQIIDDVGGDTHSLKAATAWLGGKMAPIRAGLGGDKQMTQFEMLEALALGVLGKRALWQALAAVCPVNQRVPSIDYQRLIARAESQYGRLESLRIAAARRALAESPTDDH